MRAMQISKTVVNVTTMARHVLGLPPGDGWSQDWANTVKDQVSFYSGHLSDCSAWTLPVGIRKADGPR